MPNSHFVTLEFADFSVVLEIFNPVGSFFKIRSWVESSSGGRLEHVGHRLVAGLLSEVIDTTASEAETGIITVDSGPCWQDKEVRAEYGVHPARFQDTGFSQVVADFVKVFQQKLEGELSTV